MKKANATTHSGFIAILGRPNVGKSTLLNRLLGQKISITSKKPQTTRHQILGIKTLKNLQAIFVDTPGIHLNPKRAINRLMIKAATRSIKDVDIIIFVLDARLWTDEDQHVLKHIAKSNRPLFIALNKIDFVKDKLKLLPLIENVQQKLKEENITNFEIMPISAKHGTGVVELEEKIFSYLPSNPHFYPADQVTDRSERFMVTEIIREKLMRLLGEELPHTTTVEIETFVAEEKITNISAVIWVERRGQKPIVIGKGGEKLKAVGKSARLDIEKLLAKKVFLTLWVKIKEGWTDDQRALRSLGYE